MALTRITKGVIKPNENYDTHNINSTGIITATKFVGPLEASSGSTGTFDSLTVTGNVSVGGTLTYEDVTNIDSVGIITARDGLKVLAGGANVVGVVTATSFVGGLPITNGADNRVITASSASAIQGETNLYFNGTSLSVGGSNVTDVNLLTLNGTGASTNIGVVFNKTNSPAKAHGIQVHNGTGDLIFYDYTASATRLRITSGGNVVVGNFTPVDTRNDGGIHIRDNKGISFKSHSSSSSRNWRIRNDDSAWGNLDFGVGSSNSDWADAANGADTVLSLSSSRRVGINEVSPDAPLHITGGLPSILLENSGTSASADDIIGKIEFKHNDSDDPGVSASIKCVAEDNAGNTYLTFNNEDGGNATERLRIKSDGNIEVSTATDTSAHYIKINANRSTHEDHLGGVHGVWNGNTVGAINFLAGADTSNKDDGHLQFITYAGGTAHERVRITTGGSVNIGGNFTQTTYKAQIQTGTNKFISFGNAAHNDLSNEASGIFFSRQSDGSKELCGIFNHSNTGLSIAARDHIILHAGGSSTYGAAPERLRIHSTGQIGIKTTSIFSGALLSIGNGQGANIPSGEHIKIAPSANTITFLDSANNTSDTGNIQFWNTVYNNCAAKVEFYHPAANLGGIKFHTKPASGGTPVERLCINHEGQFHMGGGNSWTYANQKFVVVEPNNNLGMLLQGNNANEGVNLTLQNIVNANNAYSSLSFADDGGQIFGVVRGKVIDKNANTGELQFWTSGSQKLTIDKDGKVGIGIHTVSSQLEIVRRNVSSMPNGNAKPSGASIWNDGGDIFTGRLFWQGGGLSANSDFLTGINNEGNVLVAYNYGSNKYMQKWHKNAQVELYHNNIKRLSTWSDAVNIYGDQDAAAILHLYADQGDNNDDKWRIRTAAAGSFNIESYATGSWVNNLNITSGGQIQLPRDGQELTWGASQQFRMFWENSESRGYIKTNGAYGLAFRINNGNRIEINGTSGDVTMQGASGRNFNWDNSDASLYLTDNNSGSSARLKIGSSGDLQMYHDVGSHLNFITCSTNADLKISTKTLQVYEYTGSTKKFEVTNRGKYIGYHADTAEYGASNWARTGSGNQSNSSQATPEGSIQWQSDTSRGVERYKSYIQTTTANQSGMYITIQNSGFYRITVKASHNSTQADVAMWLVYGLNSAANASNRITQIVNTGNFTCVNHNTHVNSHDSTIKIDYTTSVNQGLKALVEQIGGF